MTLNVRSHNIMHEQEEYKCKREKNRSYVILVWVSNIHEYDINKN